MVLNSLHRPHPHVYPPLPNMSPSLYPHPCTAPHCPFLLGSPLSLISQLPSPVLQSTPSPAFPLHSDHRLPACDRYDDVLEPKDVYCLLGLTAFYNGFFGQCSKAFTRLESLSTIEQASKPV